jgi:hypothetical protein
MNSIPDSARNPHEGLPGDPEEDADFSWGSPTKPPHTVERWKRTKSGLLLPDV